MHILFPDSCTLPHKHDVARCFLPCFCYCAPPDPPLSSCHNILSGVYLLYNHLLLPCSRSIPMLSPNIPTYTPTFRHFCMGTPQHTHPLCCLLSLYHPYFTTPTHSSSISLPLPHIPPLGNTYSSKTAGRTGRVFPIYLPLL